MLSLNSALIETGKTQVLSQNEAQVELHCGLIDSRKTWDFLGEGGRDQGKFSRGQQDGVFSALIS